MSLGDMMPQNISGLILENDEELAECMAAFLKEHGLMADVTHTAAEFEAAMAEGGFDIVLMDIMLDGTSGLSVCRKLRKTSDIPVIFVTALGEESDVVLGLELGADDYIVKPFSSLELLARINRILHRARRGGMQEEKQGPAAAARISFGDWTLDINKRLLMDKDGASYEMSRSQYLILKFFLDNPDRVLTREDLLSALETDVYDDSVRHRVEVHISKLRALLGSGSDKNYIRTVRGFGYLFNAGPGAEQ